MRPPIGALLAGIVVSGCQFKGCHAFEEPGVAPPPARVRLVFRPGAGQRHRFHLVAEANTPGSGLWRTLARLDVEASGNETGDAVELRSQVSMNRLLRDGEMVDSDSLVGSVFRARFDARGRALGRTEIEPGKQGIEEGARTFIELVQLGLLLEFPREPISPGASWSAEPVRLRMPPAGEATVQPNFTLQAMEDGADGRTATIGVDLDIGLMPMQVAAGVTLEGTGSAQGTLRIRMRDGLTVESVSEQRFTHEIRSEDATLGTREVTSAIHAWMTEPEALPDLNREAPLLDTPALDARCELKLSSLAQRLSGMARNQPMFFGSALRNTQLPEAQQGLPLTSPGARLVLDGAGQVTLDGTALKPGALARELRGWRHTRGGAKQDTVLYVYADGSQKRAPLIEALAAVGDEIDVRLVAHARSAAVELPETNPWLVDRLEAIQQFADPQARRDGLRELFFAHLALCEPAARALNAATGKTHGFDDFRAAVVPALLRCGCETTHLSDLETLLYTVGGRPDLRWLPLAQLPEGETLAAAMHDAAVREP